MNLVFIAFPKVNVTKNYSIKKSRKTGLFNNLSKNKIVLNDCVPQQFS